METLNSGGKWYINSVTKEYNGQLYIFDSDGLIRLVLYKDDQSDLFLKSVPENMEVIVGELSSCRKVTLLDCKVIKRHSDNFHYQKVIIDCKYMIDGYRFQNYEDIHFKRMNFTLSNIIGWAGLSGFEFLKEEGFMHAVGYKQKEQIASQIDSGVKVIFLSELGMINNSIDVRKYEIEQTIKVLIDSESEISILQFELYLKKVKGLIELANRRSTDVLAIEGETDLYSYEIQGKKYYNKIRIYDTNVYPENQFEERNNNWLFSLHELAGENSLCLENWFEKYSTYEPIIELYCESIRNKSMSVERRFLNLVQALEAYHRRFISNKLNEFEMRINKIYEEEISDTIIDQTQKSQKYILLRSRLLDLLLLENKSWSLFEAFSNKIDFVDQVVDTRHFHTHYALNKKEKSFSSGQLIFVSAILLNLLEYYLMKEIGFGDIKLNEIRETSSEILKRYHKNMISEQKIIQISSK